MRGRDDGLEDAGAGWEKGAKECKWRWCQDLGRENHERGGKKETLGALGLRCRSMGRARLGARPERVEAKRFKSQWDKGLRRRR
jgi:hypothetical protein